jgi:hypothetical protein
MRDLIAAVVAFALVVVALRLASTLQFYQRERRRAREGEQALGRRIIAEMPAADDLVLFSEDDVRFYYGDRSIDKDLIAAVRVLINGTPIAAAVATRHARQATLHPTAFDERPEGIARDRWDVAIETVSDMVLVECGAIRERVSQELARKVFDAVRNDLQTRC